MFSITEVSVIILTIGFAVMAYFRRVFKYWENRHVPQIMPSIPFGNSENPFRVKRGLKFKIKDFYNELKSNGHKHGGFYMITQPVYIPVDPEYIKNIMVRDFEHFVDRGVYYNEKADPLSAHLFNIEGQRWRNLRTKLTPTFTSGKMKMMFQTLLDCGEQLKEEIDKIHSRKQALDIKEIVACFSTDIIGSCAFGLECNSFKDPDAEFRKYGRKILLPTMDKFIKVFFSLSFPNICKFLGISMLPKDVGTFFMNAVKRMVQYREDNDVIRKDFVQILLDLKNKHPELPNKAGLQALNIEEMAAQAFVFFVAGFETSSTTLTFCLYELTKNLFIQKKLREEINSVVKKCNGKVTYEGIMEMRYMKQVIDETLRMYPAVPTLHRICTKEYKIQNTDTILERGTKVDISVLGLHRDAEYYPDPEIFDPYRFTAENTAKRHQFTFLPFGEGPRNCIGLRFGLLQTKIGLALMLQNYEFTLNEKTPKILQFHPKSSLLSPVEKVLLDIHKIN